jgi:hypothetical protein
MINMSDELTKVKLTIMMPSDKPNKNGTVFTKEAVENAVFNLHRNLPIICSDDGTNSKVVGATTGESHIVTWDSDNNVCKMTVDGVLFNCNPVIVVNEIEDGKISDFRIAGIGLTI